MKKLFVIIVFFSLIVTVMAQVDYDFDVADELDVYSDIGDVELQESAGLTPDDFFYFLDSFMDSLRDDKPESALALKEEKIAEFKQMVDEGKLEEAKEALLRANKYSKLVRKEVTPEMDQRARESSKAVKEIFISLEGDLDDDLREVVDEQKEIEDDIAKAAKISGKIKQLCEELSVLDPLEYSRVCKTNVNSPDWQKRLDKDLTAEQRKDAEEFFVTMSKCFSNPRECPCSEFKIKKFSDACSEIAPLVAACEIDGDEEACHKLDELPDPIDLLPPHLQEAMEAVEDKFRDAEFDNHLPRECVKAGAITKESCMKVMFKMHAPEECLAALEDGRINPKNEREARVKCEEIMFKSEAPSECLDAGLNDHHECNLLMFKLDAPQECLEAGLDGSGRNDWRECDKIRFKLDAPQECLDAGITGNGRDDWDKCEVIRFKLDNPECVEAGINPAGKNKWDECNSYRFKIDADPACLEAGLDGMGRDDWKKCDKIRFKLDAPPECQKFVNERDPWKLCQPVQFKMDADPACVSAGLDGTGRDDWDECNKITFKRDAPEYCQQVVNERDPWRACEKLRFKMEAPPECQKFSGDRDPWRKCDEIRHEFQDNKNQESDFKKCDSDETLICDNGYCKCIDQQNNNEQRDDCSNVYCQEGSYCEDGRCKLSDDFEESECKDGCSQECGNQNTECLENRCVCLGNGDLDKEKSEQDMDQLPPDNTPPADFEPENEVEPESNVPEDDSSAKDLGVGSAVGIFEETNFFWKIARIFR